MPSLAMQLLGQGLQLMPVHVKLFGIENAFFLAVLEECVTTYNFWCNEEATKYREETPEFVYEQHKEMGLSFEWYMQRFNAFKEAKILDYAIFEKDKQTVSFTLYYHMVAHFVSREELNKETPDYFKVKI